MEEALIRQIEDFDGKDLEDMDEEEYERLQMALLESMETQQLADEGGSAGEMTNQVKVIVVNDDDTHLVEEVKSAEKVVQAGGTSSGG